MRQFMHVIPILDVRNINEALDYYVQRLGFQIEFRYQSDPDNYAGVYRDDVYLHMQWQAEEEFKKGTAGRLRLRIVVNDPDVLFKEYRAKGLLNDKAQINNTEWGTREFGIRDPDGNGLIFYCDL
ncbi:MAG: bleomycin resistance protein [Chitinophagaceae bacterium]